MTRTAWSTLLLVGAFGCARGGAPEVVAPVVAQPPPAIVDGPAPATAAWCASPDDPADLTGFASDARFAIQKAAGPRVTCGAVMKIQTLALDRVTSLSGFGHLTSLTHLTVVDVADGNLGPLSTLPLEALDLGPPIHLLRKDAAPEIDDLSPLESIATLRSLRVAGSHVADLTPLAELTSLSTLVLPSNRIVDASPLRALVALTTLTLDDNAISDVTPIAELPMLQELRLSQNPIERLPNLSGLRKLSSLVLMDTRVTDATPLLTLSSLPQVVLCGSPVIEDAKVAKRNATILGALRKKKISVPDFVACHTG